LKLAVSDFPLSYSKTVLFCEFLAFTLSLASGCNAPTPKLVEEKEVVEVPPPKMKYGYDLNQFQVVYKKIRRGDTFGAILEANGIDYPQVYEILQAIKGKVKVNRLKIGKPYTLLYSQDSIPTPYAFIYEPGVESYTKIQLRDSLFGEKVSKPIRTVELQAAATIENSLYETMIKSGLNDQLTYYLADVYAWTIDFFRLQKGDRFKVIYTERFVDDSISIGIEEIKAAYFEHNGKPLYAFKFESDSLVGSVDYFDANAKNLRRAFLKAPVKFSRISSRYNLRRRIKFYGNRIKPHRGTDFAASVGTPIMATANGTIKKASYSRGNGNYVTIKHNNIYQTQYLHMKKRNVRVGQYVKQGDIIGWVGMTGLTAGPHVCYRFWKYGKQVDPFKQKLPTAKPISENLKNRFFTAIESLKYDLECIPFEPDFLNTKRIADHHDTTQP
jgi:murein DD-endopeptidase MepM/ murein hydrolase activator NlpD